MKNQENITTKDGIIGRELHCENCQQDFFRKLCTGRIPKLCPKCSKEKSDAWRASKGLKPATTTPVPIEELPPII